MKRFNLNFLTLSGLLLFFAACTNNQSSTTVDDHTESLFLANEVPDSLKTNRKFEQVPAIAASEDGKVIYVAWYSGGNAPGPGNFVTVSTSVDQGETWVNDQLVVRSKSNSARIFDPALWRDSKGNVHLFYGSAKDSLVWDGFGGVNRVSLSFNGSKIAAEVPIRLSDGVMSNKPLHVQSRDFTLLPVYIDKPVNSVSGVKYPANGAFVLSMDAKSVISPYGEIVLADSIRIHDEPQLVQLSEGDFLALLRTTKGIYSAESKDFGKTWSAPKPFTAAGPTTSSRFYIGKLSSGNLLLVANNSTTRNNMMASVSRDNGKTWPYQLMLDSRDNVSYPDADQTSDGTIHVVFDRDRTGDKDILYFRFTEDDVLKGEAKNIFKSRVNK